ncbi:MerR family DNA-binding transcriptional regulator [Sulfitobacter sp. LCG007]
MTDETMTIREMCDGFNVTPRALRFYESKELLFPIREGQKRLFTRRDRARLKLILRGKYFGLSLEDIRQILDLYNPADGNIAQLERAQEVAIRRLEEMEREHAATAKAIEELRAEIAAGDERLNSASRRPLAAE